MQRGCTKRQVAQRNSMRRVITRSRVALPARLLLVSLLIGVMRRTFPMIGFVKPHLQAPTGGLLILSQRDRLRSRHAALMPSRADASSGMELWKVGPAEMYTGPAQKAMYLLRQNPQLFEPSMEEELQALARQRERDGWKSSSFEMDAKEDTLVLRQRIEEVREAERERVVTELLYLKVCSMFQHQGVSLIPSLRGSGNINLGFVDLEALTTDIYSKDALELVRDHLFSITGQQGGTPAMVAPIVVQIALIQASQVYAMSSFFGYYLRRMDTRYQLEKLAGCLGPWGGEPTEQSSNPFHGVAHDQREINSLKDYINTFGPEEMIKMTSIASKEAQCTMERQVSALFGDIRVLKQQVQDVLGAVTSPEEANVRLQQAIQSGQVDSFQITSNDIRRLVLEAVAFGALLSDSEKHVETIYELTPRSGEVFDDAIDGVPDV